MVSGITRNKKQLLRLADRKPRLWDDRLVAGQSCMLSTNDFPQGSVTDIIGQVGISEFFGTWDTNSMLMGTKS